MIIVKNRELLIPNHERYIGTTYDNESEMRLFQIPRFSQRGVDLAALTFRLDLKYANNAADTVILTKEVTDLFIYATWEITNSQLQVPGTVLIGIRATDDEVTVKWTSFTAAIYVERHLNTPGNYTGDLTEIEQMEQDFVYMKGVIDDLSEHIDYQTRDAEAWARGTRGGNPVDSTDETYHNNAKYFSDLREEATHVAEAYARGTVDGIDVESGDVGYHDNSKYWATISESWAQGGTGSRGPIENISNAAYWASIAHDYANTISFKTYDTVAQMKADTGLLAGGVCRTLGYYAVSDGGGALYKIVSAAPTTHYETCTNGLFAKLIMQEFTTPEMFGAVGDGTVNDANAFLKAIQFGLPIVCDSTKRYKINTTIIVPRSFVLVGANLTADSSDTIKEVFLVNTNGIKSRFYNCTFSAIRDKNAVTFEDTVLSSNIVFFHNNEVDSLIAIENSDISGCEYCLKNETGSILARSCKFHDSMMPIFSNTTKICFLDCSFENVASNAFYHCMYLHPYEIADNGYVTNCSFLASTPSALQCYNDTNISFANTLENVYVTNCTFKKKSGGYAAAFSYNDCKIRFNGCELNARYKGYYNNCVITIDGSIQDVEIHDSQCLIETTFSNQGKLSIDGSTLKISTGNDYAINITDGYVKIHNCYVEILTTTYVFRLAGGLLEIIDSFIKRDSSITAALISVISGTHKIINNICDASGLGISLKSNVLYSSPDTYDKETYSASQCATYTVGFYEFNATKLKHNTMCNFRTRLSTWSANTVVFTFKSNVVPSYDQFVTAIGKIDNDYYPVVLKVSTDGKVIVFQTPAVTSQGLIIANLDIATE